MVLVPREVDEGEEEEATLDEERGEGVVGARRRLGIRARKAEEAADGPDALLPGASPVDALVDGAEPCAWP